MRRKEEGLMREDGHLPGKAALTRASVAKRILQRGSIGEAKALLKHCS